MKVYIVYRHKYDEESSVEGVFSTLEKAEAFAETVEDGSTSIDEEVDKRLELIELHYKWNIF